MDATMDLEGYPSEWERRWAFRRKMAMAAKRHGHDHDHGHRGRPPFGPGFGPFGFGGPFFGRGPKVGRGDVRAAILVLLAEEPMHGYQVIQELAERSGGVWRPSPGSIYPTLQLLEDEGLIRGTEEDGKRRFGPNGWSSGGGGGNAPRRNGAGARNVCASGFLRFVER